MTILVAYDGSAPSQRALTHAVTTYPDEDILLLRVAEAASGSLAAGVDLLQEKLKELRKETTAEIDETVRDLIKAKDIDFSSEIVAGNPAHKIVEYAEEHDIDVIILGNHGRKGVSRYLLGSVAETVVRRSPTIVTVVR